MTAASPVQSEGPLLVRNDRPIHRLTRDPFSNNPLNMPNRATHNRGARSAEMTDQNRPADYGDFIAAFFKYLSRNTSTLP